MFARKLLFALFVISVFNAATVFAQSKQMLLALNKQESTLAVFDAETMKLVGKVPTGDNPHEVVVSADGKTAFVANYGAQTPGNSLSVIDLATRRETRRVDLSPLFRPHGLAMGRDGKVYFTAETNRLVARYDPAANKVDWMMGTGANGSHMLALAADQKRIYTANIGSDSVTAFEFQTAPPAPSRVTQIAVGKQPEAIDLAPDGREVWVGLNSEGAIDVIDAAINKFKEKIKLGDRPYRVIFAPGGKQVFATLLGVKEIVAIDAATKKEIKRMKIDGVPMGLVFSRDGRFAFVSVVQKDRVVKIDTAKMEIVGSVETGAGPDGLAVTEF